MQRVAIARTLITKPSVLMMDEPLANLDTKLRGEMRRFIRTLQQRLGITTIFVTHDQVEAMELADRIAVIFNGHLAQFGPPEDLYRQPVSVDVADFMGASNIFPGTMTGTDAVKTGFGTLSVVAQPGHRHSSRQCRRRRRHGGRPDRGTGFLRGHGELRGRMRRRADHRERTIAKAAGCRHGSPAGYSGRAGLADGRLETASSGILFGRRGRCVTY